MTASLDDIRQLVEGKLVEIDRDPRNVQVALCDLPEGVKIQLWDAGGAFLELEPSSPQEEESDQSTEEGEPGDELDAAKRRIAKMEEELEDLKKQMEQEKERVDELWHVNCIQLPKFDSALIEKDEVISQIQ